MLKLNKLLYLSTERPVFSDKIEPTPKQRKALVNAKNDIRDHLRPRIAEATVSLLGMPKQVDPRFRTQGSWSYKTCVQPPSMPPQEMDWDFGVYLPVDVWEDKGPPHAMAKAYFGLVETLLGDLCREKNWKLLPDKSTCIRVQIADWAHIDIPLYAAPALQFIHILEKVGVLSRNRRKFRQPINVACPAPGRWGRPNSRVTSRHFDHGNASRTSRPDCSGLDEAD